MPTDKFGRLCVKAIMVLSALILLLPLVFLRQSFYPAFFPKVVYFSVLVDLIIVFYMILAIKYPEFRPQWRQPLIICPLLFFAVQVLASALGQDFVRSFFSTFHRGTGLLVLAHIWAWYLVITSGVFSKGDWTKLLLFSMGVSGLMDLLIALEYIRTGDWQFYSVTTTVGNPTFLSLYLFLHVWLGLYLANELSLRLRRVVFTLTGVHALFIVLIGSRAVLMALIITGIAAMAVWGWRSLQGRQKRTVVVLTCAVTAFAAISLALVHWSGRQEVYLPRGVYRILYEPLDTNRTRLAQIAWQAFAQRPVLGWGWENFPYAFTKFYQPGFTGSPTYDRSHNQLLDVLALTGIIGLLAHFATWAVLFRESFKQCTHGGGMRPLLLMAGMAGYFIVNLTLFDHLLGLVFFVFIVALLYTRQAQAAPPWSPGAAVPKLAWLAAALSIPLALSLIYFNVSVGIVAIKANSAYGKSLRDPGQGLAAFKKLLENPSYFNQQIRELLAKSIIDARPQHKGSNAFESLAKWGAGEYQKNIEDEPLLLHHYLTGAMLYRFSAPDFGSGLSRAEAIVNAGLRLAPRCEYLYLEYAAIALELNRQAEADSHLRRAVELNPSLK